MDPVSFPDPYVGRHKIRLMEFSNAKICPVLRSTSTMLALLEVDSVQWCHPHSSLSASSQKNICTVTSTRYNA